MKFLRLPGVIERTGKSRSGIYADISAGLLPQPVQIGLRAVAWPDHEIDSVMAGRVAGQSQEEIRELVSRLHALRKVAA